MWGRRSPWGSRGQNWQLLTWSAWLAKREVKVGEELRLWWTRYLKSQCDVLVISLVLHWEILLLLVFESICKLVAWRRCSQTGQILGINHGKHPSRRLLCGLTKPVSQSDKDGGFQTRNLTQGKSDEAVVEHAGGVPGGRGVLWCGNFLTSPPSPQQIEQCDIVRVLMVLPANRHTCVSSVLWLHHRPWDQLGFVPAQLYNSWRLCTSTHTSPRANVLRQQDRGQSLLGHWTVTPFSRNKHGKRVRGDSPV